MPNSLEESNEERPLTDSAESGDAGKPKARILVWIKRLAITCIVILGLLAVGGYVLLELAKVEPEFYKVALQVDQQQQKQDGSEMERKILDLRNSVLIAESWSATFTQNEINGWLAFDVKQKFPDLIPPEITEPRLVVDEQAVTLAFRCEAKPFRGVAIINADIFMTGAINQVGVRVNSIHSGKIPIPLAAVADQIAEQLKKAGIEIVWNTEEDDPVAIMQLPDALIKPDIGGYIELQEIKISEGQVGLLGITHPPDF